MKRTLIPLLLLLAISTFAQQVENVVATQQGSSVIITYDLAGSPNSPYFVKLLMSKNGGQSFSQPLKYVTGDVGNAKAGNSKRIIWDAEKELTFYDGNAVFRVEATSFTSLMPTPVEEVTGKMMILKTSQSGSNITIDFILTPSEDSELRIEKYNNELYIIDILGNKGFYSTGTFGSTRIGNFVSVVKEVPIRGKIVFENVAANSQNIPLIAITVRGDSKFSSKSYLYKFKNVPIGK